MNLHMDYCKSIYGDTYTISEFIENEECGSRGEVEDYYKRLGQLLFIIYLLNGNDFHYENIIARGSQVYLIDIETLFQVANVDVISGDDTAEYMISKEYADSVLSVGILPLLGFNQNLEGKSVDISALNGKKQKLPYKILQMKNINTTEMIFEYDFGEIGGGGNIPILNGEKQFFMEYAESLIEGFSAMSAYIMKNKCEIRHYISDIFSKPDLMVRQLTKSTATYAALLQYFNHPNYLRDMSDSAEIYESRPNPFIIYIIYLLAAILAAGIGWMYFSDIDMVVKGNSVFRSNEKARYVSADTGGVIAECNTEEGQYVNKGDILFVINSQEQIIIKSDISGEYSRVLC